MHTKVLSAQDVIGKIVWGINYEQEALMYAYSLFHEQHPEIAIPLNLEDIFFKGRVIAVQKNMVQMRLVHRRLTKKVPLVDVIIEDEYMRKKDLQKKMWAVFLASRTAVSAHGREYPELSIEHILGRLGN